LAPVSVRAAVLFEDNFSYSNGSLVTVGSAKWTALTTGNDLIVDNGAALIRGDKNQDVKSTHFPAASSPATAYYAAFDLTNTVAPKGSGSYFAALNTVENAGVADYVARLYLKAAPTSGKFVLGLATPGLQTPAYSSQQFSASETIRVILGYRPEASDNYRHARLWVNPQSEADSILDVSNPQNQTVDRFALRQVNSTTNSYGTVRLDNLKISNDFGDHVAHAPEPAGLVAAMGVAFAMLQRRRSHEK
jgi:hypothetical protein